MSLNLNRSPIPKSEIAQALILEDLPESQSWLLNVLESAFPGIVTRVAATLADAHKLLDEYQPEIALIDLGLPDGSGVELIQALNRNVSNCICVVTTIFDDDQHLFPALRAGAHGYLLKDQPQSSLVVALQGIVHGHPPLSPAIARRLLGYFQPNEPDKTGLTPREIDVLTCIAKGYTIKHAAELLGLSHNTVASYVKEIYRKLNISSRAEATLEAARLGFVHHDFAG